MFYFSNETRVKQNPSQEKVLVAAAVEFHKHQTHSLQRFRLKATVH